jgi:hypothetical protein
MLSGLGQKAYRIARLVLQPPVPWLDIRRPSRCAHQSAIVHFARERRRRASRADDVISSIAVIRGTCIPAKPSGSILKPVIPSTSRPTRTLASWKPDARALRRFASGPAESRFLRDAQKGVRRMVPQSSQTLRKTTSSGPRHWNHPEPSSLMGAGCLAFDRWINLNYYNLPASR